MPTIVREDHDDLNVTLTLNIPKEDYAPKFKSKLKEYSKTASLKGFRKGQVPLPVIRKMFGKKALLDIINETVGKELGDYLEAADFDILGEPLAIEQEDFALNTKELRDYIFKFDLGLVPEFEVKGLDNNAFNRHDVTVSDKMVEDDLADALKKVGEQKTIEGAIEEEDVIKLEAVELSGPLPKEGGLTPSLTLSVKDLTAATKALIIGRKTGDTFRYDVTQLEEGKEKAFIERYFLGLNPDAEETVAYNNQFEGTIKEVTRVIPANLDQDFFDKYFGPGNVSTEAEAKKKMKWNIKRYYDNQADGLLFGEIVAQLKEANQVPLPTDFLARWIKQTGKVTAGKTAAQEVEGMQEGLRWSMIQKKLAKQYDIKVEEEEIRSFLRAQIVQYFGGQDYGDLMNDMVEKMTKDEKQVNNAYNQILANKLFEKLKRVITTNEITISTEEFEEVLKAERAKEEPTPVVEEVTESVASEVETVE